MSTDDPSSVSIQTEASPIPSLPSILSGIKHNEKPHFLTECLVKSR
jgi:hypothetical protein